MRKRTEAGDTADRVPSASLGNAATARQKLGSDPYNSAPAPTVPGRGHARPAITPTSDLALRLAGLRVGLERVLSDMEALRASTVDTANRKAVGLMLQLRLAARHLEDAIDSLLPPDEP